MNQQIKYLYYESLRTGTSIVNNSAIRHAGKWGYLEIVRYLCSRNDSTVDNNHVFQKSVERGSIELVMFLSLNPKVDPSANDNCAIKLAARNGHLSVVKFLVTLPEVDIAANDNDVIQLAARNDHIEIIEFLSKNCRECITYNIQTPKVELLSAGLDHLIYEYI